MITQLPVCLKSKCGLTELKLVFVIVEIEKEICVLQLDCFVIKEKEMVI